MLFVWSQQEMKSLVLLVLLRLTFGHEQSPLIRQTSSGLVQGVEEKIQDTLLHSFKGIPYAKAPVRDLRFQKPQAIEPWDGLYNATEYGALCVPNPGGSEDCLSLNIFTPVIDSQPKELLPVTFHIHGGGFVLGHGMLSISNLEFIAKSKTVFITFNYRLGPFGFTKCPEDSAISGNAGLFDQLLALEWVHDNIKIFGGDPSKLTITGLSAGSASVTYLTSTPLSNGLYSQKMAISGTANNPWAYIPPATAEQRCLQLLSNLGCSKESQQATSCLNSKSAQQIHEATLEIETNPVDFTYAPTVDGIFVTAPPTDENFKTAMPVPSIYVANQDECSIFIPHYFNGTHEVRTKLGNMPPTFSPEFTWSSFLSAMKSLAYLIDSTKFDGLVRLYTEGQNIEDKLQLRRILSDFASDQYFLCPIMEYAAREKKTSLFYYFIRPQQYQNEAINWFGVSHVNFMIYLFKQNDMGFFEIGKEDLPVSDAIRGKVITFLHHKNPDHVVYDEGYNEILSSFENKPVENHPRAKFCEFIMKYQTKSPMEDLQGTCTKDSCANDSK